MSQTLNIGRETEGLLGLAAGSTDCRVEASGMPGPG